MFEEDLEGGRHGTQLSEGQCPNDKVGQKGGDGNQDYATCPMTKGWIRTVLLVCLPELEREGLQWEGGLVLGDVVMLGLGMELSKVEVLTSRARPLRGKDMGVRLHWLSIKLDGEGENVDENMGVEEAVHPHHHGKQRRLWEVLVLCQGQEGFVKVAVRQEDGGVLARVGAQGKDAHNSSEGGCKDAVMAGVETTFDACAT